MASVYRHPHGAFSLTLPDEWDHAVQKATVAFFQPKTGVGAINVSAMVPSKGTVDPASVALEFTPSSIRSSLQVTEWESSVPSAHVEYQSDGKAWRVWAFCGRTRVVFVSYNCQISSIGIEDEVVDEIVNSLSVG